MYDNETRLHPVERVRTLDGGEGGLAGDGGGGGLGGGSGGLGGDGGEGGSAGEGVKSGNPKGTPPLSPK